MRDASVVGFMPSKTAAPSEPKILPFVSRKACEMFSRSWRFRSSRVANRAAEEVGGDEMLLSRAGEG